MAKPPILSQHMAERPFIRDIVSSAYALGAVLQQHQDLKDPNKLPPIGYWSMELVPEGKISSTAELECLSVVWELKAYYRK